MSKLDELLEQPESLLTSPQLDSMMQLEAYDDVLTEYA